MMSLLKRLLWIFRLNKSLNITNSKAQKIYSLRFFYGRNLLKTIYLLISLWANQALATDDNKATASAGDVLIESGTEDAVEVYSQHQGDITVEINGEKMTPSNDDDERPSTQPDDDFF